MKNHLAFISLVVFLGVTDVTHGYELATHGALTWQAYQRSVLTDATRLQDFGINSSNSIPFGSYYYDISGAQPQERLANSFEQTIIEGGLRSLGVQALSVPGWLMRGAIREDDSPGELNPQDDPSLRRPLHHFFDPFNNRPLTVPGLFLLDSDVHKAPDWAVGSRDAFRLPNTAESNRRNHYTIFDAREAMYRALTGRDSRGDKLQPDANSTLVDITDIRNAYWATTFRALGDVLHLNHDMAQPQHTRNDPHSGRGPDIIQILLTGHASIYEKYVDARAMGANLFSIDGRTITPRPLVYGDYSIPTFSKYSDYWSTSPGPSSVGGKGLADYSNRGFFTIGTNLGSNGYPFPQNDASAYTPRDDSFGSGQPCLPNFGFGTSTHFLVGNVEDKRTGDIETIRMTTESIFDAALVSAGGGIPSAPTYSLNRCNYDDMADLLIKRAVAYSAGLINYFFRGKIDLVPKPGDSTQFLIQNLGTEPMKGRFELYYDAVDGFRYPVLDANNNSLTFSTDGGYPILEANGQPITPLPTTGALSGGQSLQIAAFSPPTDPAPTQPVAYVLVFRGDMGEEKASTGTVGAVVAKVVTPRRGDALYILALDANNKKLTLKVDQRGLRQISGFDASGFPQSTGEFDPFAAGVPEGTTFPGTGASGNVPKAYVMKQVVFQDTVIPGPKSYTTVALSVGDAFSEGLTRPFSYLYDTTANKWAGNSTGVTWTAKSTDPLTGEFRFTPNVLDGRNATLAFVRKYQDASGTAQTATGSIALPTLTSGGLAGTGYFDFYTGKLLVSGDGLKVSGLVTSECLDPPLCFLGNRIYTDLNITLGLVPSISVAETRVPFSRSVSSVPRTTQVTTVQIPSPCVSPAAPITLTKSITSGSHTDTVSDAQTQFVEYINGALASHQVSSSFVELASIDETSESAGVTCANPTVRGWEHVSINRTTVYTREFTSTLAFSDGALISHSKNLIQDIASAFKPGETDWMAIGPSYNLSTQGFFEGFCPCPGPFQPVPIGANAFNENSVIRAFTGKVNDAISRQRSTSQTPGTVTLRNKDISGTVDLNSNLTRPKDYIADVSPLGELFFATSDKSIIIHDTQFSQIPRVVAAFSNADQVPTVEIPSNVVKLLGALWL